MSERVFDSDVGEPVSESASESPFGPNDRGVLRPDTRRALIALTRGPYIMRSRNPNLWAALETDEAAIREALGNLFLELVVDRDAGLALSRNLTTEEDVPKVLRSRPLTLLDTALVLFLRDKLLRGEGGRVFVGRDEIDDQLGVYGTAAGADRVMLRRRINACVGNMADHNVLQSTGEEGRYEISPILRLIFDATQIAAVRQGLRELLESGTRAVDDEETDEEEG